MIKYGGGCGHRGWGGPQRRTPGTILLLVILTATQVRAQGSVTKGVDSLGMSPAQTDTAGKKASRPQEDPRKKPTDAKRPDGSQQGDNKPPDTPQTPDKHPPAVIPSVPSVTDTAAISEPGWIEADLVGFKNLNRDRSFGTPALLKMTTRNPRLEVRLATDGYLRQGDRTDGVGDTYFALQYLYKPQAKAGFDLAGRLTTKLPTGRRELGGTQKLDFSGLLLASRDFTKWQLHGDFNLGLSSLTRADAPGVDYQMLAAASLAAPIPGGRWQIFDELVYSSPIQGQRYRATTMCGCAFAQHRYEVYSAAMQWQLHGDAATFQVLFSGSFFLGKMF